MPEEETAQLEEEVTEEEEVTPEEGEPEEETEGEPEEKPEEDPLRDLEAQTGLNLSKYKTFEAAIQGMAESTRLVGQRNAEAQQYQVLREKLGKDPLEALQELAATPEPQSKEDKVTPEQVALWRAQDAAGTLTESDRSKLNDVALKSERLLIEMVNQGDIKTFVDSVVQERVNQAMQQQSEQSVEQQQQQQMDTWIKEHSKELYLDPAVGVQSGLTPFGQQVLENYQNYPGCQAIQGDDAARSQVAYDMALAKQPKTTRKPSRAAQHEPAVAKAKKVTQTVEEWAAKQRAEGKKVSLAEMARLFGPDAKKD